MRRAGIRPNESTHVTVLSACAQSGDLTTEERIKTWIVLRNLSSNVRLVNALIDMYSKCNKLDKARSLFDNMINMNIVTWNVMIGGYTHTHRYKESLEFFRTMLQSNYEANEVMVRYRYTVLNKVRRDVQSSKSTAPFFYFFYF
ncbi:putative tetratricopeptide-like helical domain superfamily [Helianthus annuus]|uniref:Putative tetratricopeptide-like helical domain-containing protein n=1 Tax=Helianthus annuus TaxID=4232 RepID=A0A251SCJ7_HELAN|nr:putative tetratricopeptide-like helical domain superfamily [Helianthus annuus]KAJ0451187.1 putative tetratricopeptide-like helical domain superfamily [Helianthus annuus]KAJ0455617.1 putative tetratricopeptide-like helical domain superfamily [Helianthus annuus]KAJ0473056.1 putative tetratricopeptide-like helical domain superfamily [Helianthus annuus]KAJ0648658.1 putative tetratricopeptide-like helical domain superfamily [Helianthus annuus]